jgi:hypothetical protein
MPLTADERTAIISKAMDKNFGDLLTWERPVLAHTFGENDLDQVDVFVKNLIETRSEVLVALEIMPDDDLNVIQRELEDDFRLSERNRAAISGERIRRLRRVCPPPIAFGFGHPSFTAKFDHWARMPRLSLHEVSLLSLGADPSCMKNDKFAELKKTLERGKSLWAAHASFLEQREIFSRCFDHTGFGYASEGIVRIKRWIDDLDIQVHPQFYEGLEARIAQKQVEVLAINATTPEQSLNRVSDQETETLYKLIAAMAIKGYMFEPDAKRNQATADIQSDLDQLGISLDQKTILKWVRIACDVVPKD